MSNPNKTEINKAYGEMVRNSISNVINNTTHDMIGLNFNEAADTGTDSTHTCTSNETTIINDFKLTDVNMYNNRSYKLYELDKINNMENLYPTIINCSPQNLAIEMKKEMVIAMNAMMKIKDVDIIVPNKVVKVTFNDNTFEKAICHEEDTFSLETAITICMTKHLLGGSSKFNKILANGVKIVNDKVKAKEEVEKEKARIEAKRLKNHNKRVERRKKKEAEARNARIQEHAEAIKLANEMMNNKMEA